MTQKGFAPIILVITLAVLFLGGGGWYFYTKNSPKMEKVEQNVTPPTSDVSPSPKASIKSNSIPIQITTSISTAKPKSTPVASDDKSLSPPPPPPAPEIIINAAGSYTYSGQEIKYAISFPKNGGSVNGNVSGLCSGPISGNFSGGDGGDLNSGVDAKCQLGILQQDLKADFKGKVYFSQGRADLEWQGSIPFYSGSKEFSLTFNPL